MALADQTCPVVSRSLFKALRAEFEGHGFGRRLMEKAED